MKTIIAILSAFVLFAPTFAQSEKSKDDFVYMSLTDERIRVQASLYDSYGHEMPGVFEVDTGMGITTIDSVVADKLKLTQISSTKVDAIGGSFNANVFLLPKLKFSSMDVQKMEVVVKTLFPNPKDNIDGVIGVLGANAFRTGVITFDFPGSKAALTLKPINLIGYTKIADEPIKIDQSNVFVACKLPGNNDTNCTLMIDTGNQGEVVFCDEMKKFIHLKDSRKTDLVAGPHDKGTTAEIGHIQWILIGKLLRIDNPEVGLYQAITLLKLKGSKYCSGSLGITILNRYAVQIDYPEKRIRFFQKEK